MAKKRRVFIAHKSTQQERAALMQAIKTAGSLRGLAEVLGVTKQAVFHWKDRTIPAEYVVEIEHATGVPREQLRPDLYRPAQKEKAATRR